MAFPLQFSATAVRVIRILQLILAIIVLGLTAYVANWWTSNWNATSPGVINFLIFASVWTLLATAYLVFVPLRMSETKFNHHYGILAVELLTMIFWFAGFIALACFLTGRVCWGAPCNSAIAAVVLASFEWALFAITSVMAVSHTFGHKKSTAPTQKSSLETSINPGV